MYVNQTIDNVHIEAVKMFRIVSLCEQRIFGRTNKSNLSMLLYVMIYFAVRSFSHPLPLQTD